MSLPQHQVQFFADGSELAGILDLLADQHSVLPRVILLDIDMPKLNGFQTLSKLKHHDYWQDVPVIMMTNREQAEFRQESFRLKASAFTTKASLLASQPFQDDGEVLAACYLQMT